MALVCLNGSNPAAIVCWRRGSFSDSRMSLLYYWRPDNYAHDRAFGFGYHLNQNSPAMAQARAGTSLWAFTRHARTRQYVLAAELVVRALTRNPPGYRYGTYRIWGDLEASRYFDIDRGPSVEALVRGL